MKSKKRINDNIDEEKSETIVNEKTKKSPFKKRNNFSFNEITDKVKTIELEYNTPVMIKYLDLYFKLSTRDFYDKKELTWKYRY